jgi:3-hydroxybutyrate dehydrogenase
MGSQGRLVALVTGSSTRGIGRGIVSALALDHDAVVYIHGLETPPELDKIACSLNEELGFTHERRIFSVSGDVRVPDTCKAIVDALHSTRGRLDILVNNAGCQHVSPIEAFPVDEYDRVVDTILKSTFFLTSYALPAMRDRGFGRVINTGSMHASVASPYKSAYNAAKHGVLGLTKTVALETATAGNVTCNAVSPGYVWTELLEKQVKNQAKALEIREEDVVGDVFLKDQPIKRFISPEEVGRVVSFLAEEGNGGITGANICVDGGWTAR